MRLFRDDGTRYLPVMRSYFKDHATSLRLLAGMVVLGAISGLSFAAWADKGPAIFMAFLQSGMAWCF
jgi:hypothetical protein